MLYSPKLKTILQSRYLFKITFILIIFYAFLKIYYFPEISKYSNYETNITGIITQYKIDGDHLSLELKGKEKIIVNYYCKTKSEKEYYIKKLQLGTKLKISGTLKEPSRNTIPNLFDYKKYLRNKKIFYLMDAEHLKIMKENTNLFYNFKNFLLKRMEQIDNTGYMRTFILGDKTLIEQETKKQFQENGISHLFSISGMHVSFLVGILLLFLNKITYNNKIKYIILSIFLLFYLYLTNGSPSIIRTTIMFIVFAVNKCYNLKIKSLDLMLIVLQIAILIHPFILQEIGFQFSYIVSTSLILSHKKIAKFKKKWQQSIYISYLSFIVSLPLNIYHFQSINFLSIVFNIIMIPFVSLIIFPLTFIIFFIPRLYFVYSILITVLEQINFCFSQIKFLEFTYAKPQLILVPIYYVFIILSICQKKYYIILSIILLIHFFYPLWNNKFLMTFLDVGQGDAILIKLPNNKGNILIDTGGQIQFPKENWQKKQNQSSLAEDRIIPYLKTLGITTIDYLILTHGDYDHIGEAKNLIENMKIKNVIFNKGEYNTLEINLINILKQRKIPFYKSGKKLKIDQYNIFFLNQTIYKDENQNSNIIYFQYFNYKFLLTGDASINNEREIIQKYNLPHIDFLKVGHHGSDTSTSEEFITKITPKISIISVGQNNRYHHPKDVVLKRLKNSQTYRTDHHGSIILEIRKKYKILNYSPNRP